MIKQCLKCDKQFNIKPSEIKKGGGKHCSRACYSQDRPRLTSILKACLVCNKEFYITPLEIKSKNGGAGKYCSRKCYKLDRPKISKEKWQDQLFRNMMIAGMKGHIGYWAGRKRPETTGKNNPNWHGGITNPRTKIMKSLEYKNWRMNVFRRDDFTCQECGARSGNGRKIVLNADHIKPFSKYQELRFDLNNGRTICTECHIKTPTFGGRAVSYAEGI